MMSSMKTPQLLEGLLRLRWIISMMVLTSQLLLLRAQTELPTPRGVTNLQILLDKIKRLQR